MFAVVYFLKVSQRDNTYLQERSEISIRTHVQHDFNTGILRVFTKGIVMSIFV